MAAILEIDNVTKVYPSGVRANEEISLSAQQGEIFGLLGPNGAGKTTLVGQVLGLLSPTSGTIRIDDTDVTLKPAQARRACSYQAQTTSPIEGLTPLQAIEIVGRIRGGYKEDVRTRARELVDALQIDDWANKFVPLSGGVARLTSFCMAAIQPGRIVVLDEPTNDVDPLRRKLLWQQIRSLADAGPAVILVTHNVLEAERCVDRLAVIDRGRVLAQGTPDALKSGLGGQMRLEIVLEPDVAAPSPPGFVAHPTVAGRHLIGDISLADAGPALQWAQEQKDSGQVAEFSIGPASLEDLYVRLVDIANGHPHDELVS